MKWLWIAVGTVMGVSVTIGSIVVARAFKDIE